MADKTGIKIDGYNSGPSGADTKPPAAAVFDKGARSLAEIQQSADARREHSRQISNLPHPAKQSRDL